MKRVFMELLTPANLSDQVFCVLSLGLYFCDWTMPMTTKTPRAGNADSIGRSAIGTALKRISVREDERRRIAHELHNAFGQDLVSVIIEMNRLVAHCNSAAPRHPL